jgi:hypothetical protein
VKFTAFEAPPPGAEFVTTTGYVPAVAWSLSLNGIVNWVEFTNVAACGTALYVTVEVARKFVPLIVRVCAGAPAVAEVGDRLVIVGRGLVAVTVKFTVFETPPPGAGFVTTTG